MQGQVYRIHSDFYYVKLKDSAFEPVECKLREILKKQKLKIKVGDYVEINEDNAIVQLLKRKNFLLRPSVANLDYAIVAASLLEPEIDFIQLNRYLTFLKYNKIPVILCFNKDDLLNKTELEECKKQIISVYQPLGYKIFFTSAAKNEGILELKKIIRNKTVVFVGQSGVGKSSIVNVIAGSNNQRTGFVSRKNKKGCHTTRHSEIIEFGEYKITDTPGFSKLSFDFILPKDLSKLFLDIEKYAVNCKYSDCLHEENDEGCYVLKNLDNIDTMRYQSYLSFLKEAKTYKQKTIYESQKEETTSKNTHKKSFAKISSKKKAPSRKKINQTADSIKYSEELYKND